MPLTPNLPQPPNLPPNLPQKQPQKQHPNLPPSSVSPAQLHRLRLVTLGGVIALVLLGLLWETWLAPLRPGGSMLFLKVVPLILLLPGLWRGQRRTVQALSLVIQIYLTEGLVRATSDPGFSANLAWSETFLSTVVFAATLLWAKGTRGPAADSPTDPAVNSAVNSAADPAELIHESKLR